MSYFRAYHLILYPEASYFRADHITLHPSIPLASNFLKPKGQRDYPALRLDAKTAKTNADKAQLFAESVERHFGIQSDNSDLKHFDEVNQFIEDNYVYFYPPEDPDDYRADMDDDHDLVADIDF